MSDSWLVHNAPRIAAIKDIVTIFVTPFALLSIVIAISQLAATNNSIKSNTVYQITHEGREISREIAKSRPLQNNTGMFFNFIHSVWHQHRLGTIDEDIWKPFTEEVCQLLKERDVSGYWNETNKRLFSTDFVNFIEEQRKQCAI